MVKGFDELTLAAAEGRAPRAHKIQPELTPYRGLMWVDVRVPARHVCVTYRPHAKANHWAVYEYHPACNYVCIGTFKTLKTAVEATLREAGYSIKADC